ncbi:hypothetical protein DRO61_05835 [Candidatus Bathyarchaeota archaeon]|nr:MAG: hypothetical protein DRO61_05835 [Candidatus Bathyarchaeota archaeon]
MSYCAAENTLRAIRQLCGIIEEGGKNDDVESKTGYEYLAIKQLEEEGAYLSEICNQLIERYGD